jgi:hypothetical protein
VEVSHFQLFGIGIEDIAELESNSKQPGKRHTFNVVHILQKLVLNLFHHNADPNAT